MLTCVNFRQRQKLIAKKKEDARKKRQGTPEGSGSSGDEAGTEAAVQIDAWRLDKDLGASLDRAARQAWILNSQFCGKCGLWRCEGAEFSEILFFSFCQALKEGKFQEAAELAQRAVE